MDCFWFLMPYLLLLVALIAIGGADAARGQKGLAIFKISFGAVLLIINGLLLYYDGLAYGTGHPFMLHF